MYLLGPDSVPDSQPAISYASMPMTNTAQSGNLVWIDLEMTGLDPEVNTIIEIATIVTNGALETIAEGPVLAIHVPEAHLAQMDEWNTSHHSDSGLLQRVRESGVPLAVAEDATLAFISAHVGEGESPLCGNSVGQDRRFLARYMPRIEAYLHYRCVDVSTIKELVRRWQPELLDGFKKKNAHLALDDIRESIEELRYYRSCVFSI